jgi:hypothetical protein
MRKYYVRDGDITGFDSAELVEIEIEDDNEGSKNDAKISKLALQSQTA